MSNQNRIKLVERQLSKGNLTEVLDDLEVYFRDAGEHDLLNQVILLKARWTVAEKGYKVLGTSSKEEYNATFSNTIEGVQLILKTSKNSQTQNKVNKLHLVYILFALILIITITLIFINHNPKTSDLGPPKTQNEQFSDRFQNPLKEEAKPPVTSKKTKETKINPVLISITSNLKDIEDLEFVNSKFTHFFNAQHKLLPKTSENHTDYEININVKTDLIQSSKLFGKVINKYKVQVVIECLYVSNQTICFRKPFEILLEDANNGTESIVQKNGLIKILNTLTFNIDDFLCL